MNKLNVLIRSKDFTVFGSRFAGTTEKIHELPSVSISRNFIKTFQIEGTIALITKMLLIFS